MPLPKSVTKISKNGVEFVSSVDRANYLITELTRAAMKDVAKYVLRIVRANVRAISSQTKKMRYAGMRYQYWVRKKECDLQLGIENTKFGAESAWWADQSELGTGNQPKRGFLRAAVYEEAMVDEEENDPGADDE